MNRGDGAARRWTRRYAGVALRVAADATFLVVALAVSLILRYTVSDLSDAEQVLQLRWLWNDFRVNAPMLVLVCVTAFALHGFYTRARAYRGRFKLLYVFQAVGVAYLGYLAVMFMAGREWMPPRSVAVGAWAIASSLIVGARWCKDEALHRYRITPRVARATPREAEHVLVIGGAGYLGSVLCRRLLDDGRHVRVLDSLLFGDESVRPLFDDRRFELVREDFRRIDAVVRAIKDTDAVVHLGAVVGDPACELDGPLAVEINSFATQTIREIGRGYGVSRFVFMSTCSVYGAGDFVLDEESSVHPLSLYAKTKIDSEKALLDAAGGTFAPTILRLATVFGLSPRPRFDLVVNLFAALAASEGRFTVINGHQWRPFIHVRDVARAIQAVLDADPELVRGQVFNVGSDRLNHRIEDVAAIVAREVPGASYERTDNDQDARNYRVSFKKFRERLGFEAEYDIAFGAREIRDAIRNGRIHHFRDPRYHNVRSFEASRPARLSADGIPVLGLAPPPAARAEESASR